MFNPDIVQLRYIEGEMEREANRRLTILLDEELNRQHTPKKQLANIREAKKDYICDLCNQPIKAGTQYRWQSIPVGFGWPEGIHYQTRRTHLVCVAKKEGGVSMVNWVDLSDYLCPDSRSGHIKCAYVPNHRCIKFRCSSTKGAIKDE